VESSCEHGNEPLGSIKYHEILELLMDWQLLKKDSAPALSPMHLLYCRMLF
jgi:hypothetical protein